MTKKPHVLVVSVAIALLAPSPGAAASSTLDALQEESELAAGQGAAVWSRYDATTKAYRLVVHRRGLTSLPAIAPRPVDFDADVGSDSAGRPAVVYSRCASYKHDRGPSDRWICTACRSPRSGSAGSPPRARSTRAASEYEPTLWHGELAWIAERGGSFPAVYHRSLTARASRAGRRLAEIISYDVAGGGSSTEVRLVGLRSRARAASPSRTSARTTRCTSGRPPARAGWPGFGAASRIPAARAAAPTVSR